MHSLFFFLFFFFSPSLPLSPLSVSLGHCDIIIQWIQFRTSSAQPGYITELFPTFFFSQFSTQLPHKEKGRDRGQRWTEDRPLPTKREREEERQTVCYRENVPHATENGWRRSPPSPYRAPIRQPSQSERKREGERQGESEGWGGEVGRYIDQVTQG